MLLHHGSPSHSAFVRPPWAKRVHSDRFRRPTIASLLDRGRPGFRPAACRLHCLLRFARAFPSGLRFIWNANPS
ncbi:hypothetical protein BSLA_02f4231 [Burkholderia stabilis]|nr:hypothetical protein BSLA_02f4231 [Burkholderia stabilis]